MPDYHVPYRPTRKQRLFHLSEADEILYGGAAGGGKSTAVVMDALMRCLRHPGTHAYLFRRTYPELKDSLIREALKRIPAGLGKYVATTHDWTLPGGSSMHFRHCHSEDDVSVYKGAEFHYLYIDELTSFTQQMVDFLRTRLRAERRLGIKPLARYTSNPGGLGHAWVKAAFVSCAAPYEEAVSEVRSDFLGGRARSVTRLFIPATVLDNPHITDDYVFELERKPRALRDAYLLGSWDAFEGQVFSEFVNNPDGYFTRQRTHVIEPFRIPPGWRRVRALDWGYSRPYAVTWWAVGGGGEVYLYRELYGCAPGDANTGVRRRPSDVAREILRIEDEGERGLRVAGVADPAVFGSQDGEPIGDIMAREGVFFDRANNARVPGKMQVHERLRMDDNGFPSLYVFKNCVHSLRTVPALCYSPVNPEDVDTRGEDHLYDTWRYFLMTQPM